MPVLKEDFGNVNQETSTLLIEDHTNLDSFPTETQNENFQQSTSIQNYYQMHAIGSDFGFKPGTSEDKNEITKEVVET